MTEQLSWDVRDVVVIGSVFLFNVALTNFIEFWIRPNCLEWDGIQVFVTISIICLMDRYLHKDKHLHNSIETTILREFVTTSFYTGQYSSSNVFGSEKLTG